MKIFDQKDDYDDEDDTHDGDDDVNLVSFEAVQACVVRKIQGLQTVVPADI